MEYISEDPDMLECYAITGEYDYLIKGCAVIDGTQISAHHAAGYDGG